MVPLGFWKLNEYQFSQYLVFKESNMLYHFLEVHFKSHGGWVEVVNVLHGFSVHDYSKPRGTGFARRRWAGNFRRLPRVNHPALVQHNWCSSLSKFRRWSFGAKLVTNTCAVGEEQYGNKLFATTKSWGMLMIMVVCELVVIYSLCLRTGCKNSKGNYCMLYSLSW